MSTYLPNSSGIYKIINIVNNKVYIGGASNVSTRRNAHLHDLRNNHHGNSYLQNDWNKYEEVNFKFELIESCDIKVLHEKEHFWANHYECLNKDVGYNIKPTDPNGCSIHSEETKEKLRQVNKNKKPHQKCIDAIKIYNASEKGIANFTKTRAKLQYVDYVKVNAHKRKKIKNLVTGEIYESLIDVANILNKDKSDLSKRLRGKRKNNTNLIYL